MVRLTDRPAMTIAVDLGRKATKQTNKQNTYTYHNDQQRRLEQACIYRQSLQSICFLPTGRLAPKIKHLAPLHTSAWVFKGVFCAYVIRPEFFY